MAFPFTIYGKEGDQFTTSSTQTQLPLGTRMVMPDGRVYRWCQNGGTAIQAGLLLVTKAIIDGINYTHQLASDAAAGATSVQVNATAATGPASINDLDEGYVFFSATGATGQGEIHKIYRVGSTNDAGDINSASKSYAWTTATGTFMTIHLLPDDVLQNAWTTETGVARIAFNKHRDVLASQIAAGSGGAPVGVSNCHVAANYYFWAQTWGPCPVEYSSDVPGLAVGVKVCAATAANSTGNIQPALSTQALTPTASSEGGWTNPVVGSVIATGADTFMALIDLTIAP